MTDFHDAHPFAVGGGLNLADAPELIDDADSPGPLENVRYTGFGRWTFPRRTHRQLFAGLVDPCGVHAMPHGSFVPDGETEEVPIGLVILDWADNEVKLYASDGRVHMKLIGTLAGWSDVSERPKTIAAVMGQVLWICDEGKEHGLTYFDPTNVLEQGSLFQPYFKFDQNVTTPEAPIRCRTVEAYNNMLITAGYGDEEDPDRPEVLRHSYIGFTTDDPTPEGLPPAGGDAALVPNPDFVGDDDEEFLEVDNAVQGLFAVEDYMMIGVRGQPIVGLKSGAERLVVATRFQAFILFGYDRLSFNVDLVDAQRGCVASRAIVEADGIVYWYSPLGPCRWGGQRVQPLDRQVLPMLEVVRLDTVWALHQRTETEVRWFFADGPGDPKRSVDFNYRYERWKTSSYPFGLFCGGSVKPGTILEPVAGGAPVPVPLTAPAGLGCVNVQAHQITVAWANGETGPDIQTNIFVTGGNKWPSKTLVETVESGVEEFTLNQLQEKTPYTFDVEHEAIDTGDTSPSDTTTCTTRSDSGEGEQLPPPEDLSARVVEVFGTGQNTYIVKVAWTNALAADAFDDLRTEVELDATNALLGVQTKEEPLPDSNVDFTLVGAVAGAQIEIRARHKTGINSDPLIDTDEHFSPWTDRIAVFLVDGAESS